jgi:hypothetical protein
MYHAVLEGACLAQANLGGATLSGSTLRSADLREADFTLADLSSVKFDGSDLSNANLQQTDLDNASLQNANLCNASLFRANLTDTNLSASDLTGANLNEARLVRTILTASTLSKSHIYGVAAWDVKLEQTRQLDLVISRRPFITVDDLELAQFVYLLLNNSKLKNVIGTITSKTVLILGRFTEPRKRILDALRRELRGRNYIPIVFDFVPSEDRSLTETIQLLANMARFVIADVTAAKSIPQELSHIVPFLPSVAVQPIILSSESEFALFEHWQRFNSVLPVFRYDDESHLLASLESQVIGAAENWTSDRNENQRLREEIKRLQAQLPSH